ncbi:MAG TPA: 3',5'-cyclic-nucleotide phosphodiesterase [Smithellaceae bacterium]|nr:3',5'-cyclic-nucleotide phosphodiesterase [Smithellaceae bacterium]
MKIRVLGCHGSQLPNYNTTGFLLGDNVLVDAGTVTPVLTLREQLKIDYIFITHAHMDHVRDLMFLADNVFYSKRQRPLYVCSSKGVLDALSAHLFNNVIWPDFSKIPDKKNPLIRFKALAPGRSCRFGDFLVRTVAVNHTVETMGYFIEMKKKAVLFLGDTGPTEKVWRMAKAHRGLRAIFVETSLPDAMTDVADKTGHLTPQGLAAELQKLSGAKPDIYLYHMKPWFHEAIREEVKAISDRKIHIVEDGQVIRL